MNNYDDYEDENSIAAESIAGVSKVDWFIALAIAAGVFVMLGVWSYPGTYPPAWTDVAVAAGARPPQSVVPGLWRLISMVVFKTIGLARGLVLYKLLGHIIGALSVALVFVFFRQWLSVSIRHRRQLVRRRMFTVRVAATVAAVAFASSEPFWRSAQMFTSVTLIFFLAIVAMTLFSMFIRNGSMSAVYLCLFVAGMVAAESPLGVVGVMLAWMAYLFITRYGEQFAVPLINPATAQVSKWHLTFLFVLGFLIVVGLNCYSFITMGGLKAMGDPGMSALPIKYINNYAGQFSGAASLVGWLFLAALIILPWFVSAAMLPKATDEEHFLSYGMGLVYIVASLFAVSQFCFVKELWIWGWKVSEVQLVTSPLFMIVMAMLAAASIMNAIVVLGIDGFCRDHKFIAQHQYGLPTAGEEAEYDDGYAVKPKRLSRKVEARLGRTSRFVVVMFMLLVVPALTVPSRYCAKTREMLGLMHGYIDLVLRETAGRQFVFTDGRYDSGLEIAAISRGRRLIPISFMSGRGDYDTNLRLRGLSDAEDRRAASSGGAELLRTWMHDKPESLTNCCAQIGIEFWKHEGSALPRILGLVARPGESDPSFISESNKARDELAGRLLDFYRRHRDSSSNDQDVEALFDVVQWRLARIAMFRGMVLDQAGDVDGSKAEVTLAESLDQYNKSLQGLKKALDEHEKNAPKPLTPRECLRRELDGGDYAKASIYADPILKSDPENPEANFAKGMLYMNQGQYSRAEDHLKRCLVLGPRLFVVYNNLAVIQMRMHKFDAALKNAKRALELAPGSAEILDTIHMVEVARDAAATNSLPVEADAPKSQMMTIDPLRR